MPFKPGERQYRTFAASNFQTVQAEESDEPSYKVRGYFTTFGDEYLVYEGCDWWPAEYEQIDARALDAADMTDVIFQENHEGSPLARQRNGSLTIGVDDHGAWCEAYLGGCQRGRDAFESIQNGLLVEMSFAFTIAHDEDGEGYTTFRAEDGTYHHTITRISKVYDCSVVSIPANPATDISELRMRSYAAARIEADHRAEEEARAAAQADETPEEPIDETTDAPEEPAEPTEEPIDEPATEEPTEDLIDEALNRRSRRQRRARAMQLRTLLIS